MNTRLTCILDWYHDTSAVITEALLSPSGYQNSIAAPPPNSALINGQGIWDCATYGTSDTCFTQTPLEIQVVPNKKYRFRLINAAAHGKVSHWITSTDFESNIVILRGLAMFYFSVDSHTLNVTGTSLRLAWHYSRNSCIALIQRRMTLLWRALPSHPSIEFLSTTGSVTVLLLTPAWAVSETPTGSERLSIRVWIYVLIFCLNVADHGL